VKTINLRHPIDFDSAILLASRMRVQWFARTAAETGNFRLPVHRTHDARRHLSRINLSLKFAMHETVVENPPLAASPNGRIFW
jgi:hypothetical protein